MAAGHIYYSPGLWALLGYDPARRPSSFAAWESLVHPDDLPLLRRSTDAQLGSAVSFVDLTVLVGPQATGKSLFLQLAKLLTDGWPIP